MSGGRFTEYVAGGAIDHGAPMLGCWYRFCGPKSASFEWASSGVMIALGLVITMPAHMACVSQVRAYREAQA